MTKPPALKREAKAEAEVPKTCILSPFQQGALQLVAKHGYSKCSGVSAEGNWTPFSSLKILNTALRTEEASWVRAETS